MVYPVMNTSPPEPVVLSAMALFGCRKLAVIETVAVVPGTTETFRYRLRLRAFTLKKTRNPEPADVAMLGIVNPPAALVPPTNPVTSA